MWMRLAFLWFQYRSCQHSAAISLPTLVICALMVQMCGVQAGTWSAQGPLTKAIVFSHFWMHIQLICAHLRAHNVMVKVLKRDLSPAAKAEALDVFQVRCVLLWWA